MSDPSDRPLLASSSVVRGLSGPQREMSVEPFFDAFVWVPSAHVALAQWDSRRFFDHFLR